MAMQLSSELVHMTRNYNISLAQLLSADDATLHNMRFQTIFYALNPERKPIVKFPTLSKFCNPRLPKLSENFQIMDY